MECARIGGIEAADRDLIRQNIVVTIAKRSSMTKKLIQHGNSAALVIEKPVLQLLGIDFDTELEIVTDGKNLIISPVAAPEAEAELLRSLERVNLRHSTTLAKLAK